jgi:2-desacetyl-2-hydroxyethyl bacteriochlorophyllide A dehydrogenase
MPRKITAVVFDAGSKITVQDFDHCPCGPEDVVVKSIYSMVSSGTELRTLAETTAPQIPGYSVIGEIVEVGEKVKGYRPGDLISTRNCPRLVPGINSPCGGHASFHVIPATGEDRPVLLPPGAKPLDYVVSELGAITIRGVEGANPQPGETCIVVGQGMIGALSAAWFHSRGCKVIVTDVEQRRLDRAMKWGAYASVLSGPDAKERLLAYVNRGADIVVEGSGSSPGFLLALQLLRPTPQGFPGSTPHYRGETIGRLNHSWPRLVLQASYQKDVPMHPHGFFPGEGLTVITPSDRSWEDRARSVENIRQGKIKSADFIDRIISYKEAPAAYAALRDDKNANFSLVFDWSK